MKIVILGSKGMLGHYLIEAFKDESLFPFSKEELDIADKEAVKKNLMEIKPELVINAAGYTDVDGCESNYNLAISVNADGVRNIAEACEPLHCDFLHVSTDYVFNGEKERYTEDDEPNPINSYGKSKYLGEKYLKEAGRRYFIIRTSGLYGDYGKNFVDTIINLAKTKKEIEVVDDQRTVPTYAKDFAEAIRNFASNKPEYGTYHLTNDGSCTWFEFAKKIIEIQKSDSVIKPTTSGKISRPAKRPRNSVLVNTKIPKLRHWEDALRSYLAEKQH